MEGPCPDRLKVPGFLSLYVVSRLSAWQSGVVGKHMWKEKGRKEKERERIGRRKTKADPGEVTEAERKKIQIRIQIINEI